ncbi:fasciculation and elongation protein zeta-2 isoform X1 [Electrophorus electricus]|uniref:fasciculation and elongation protein zeta-2 isoform X1 n=1 Tax=Electrophorus electricus TaxID=8005 RepID=UPI0015CFF894|nr:fasciculation and elongation protein zeta-2 isoform X1 [Electrophorus electricus]
MAAPLEQLDKWKDFNEFTDIAEREKQLHRLNLNVEEVSELLKGFPDHDKGLCGETFSFKSMEDLVNDFDEKLIGCFGNFNNKSTEVKAPVKPISEDTVLKNDEIWNALTDNYGNVMPVDWSHSRSRSLHLPTLNIEDRPKVDNMNLDVSDDEDLREQMDMHSIIVSCISEEPLFTAEQVIEEIEEMMQNSPDSEAEQSATQSDLFQRASSNCHSYEERVRNLSVAELNELLEEVETAICRYSEELVQHLALRDELDFEKEVKNSFISVLIDVQNRQKEHREFLKKKRKLKNGAGGQHGRAERLPKSRFSMESISTAIQNGLRQTFGNGVGDKQVAVLFPSFHFFLKISDFINRYKANRDLKYDCFFLQGSVHSTFSHINTMAITGLDLPLSSQVSSTFSQYLTTVIPYEKKGGPPSVGDLQILTKILEAMRDDSDNVPSLLTDYILKVLCPT